ncbi:MAG: hypothetical protein HY236_04615 [Acidobacteria bacterium]|nr:hypothetical protein [Acidobacteriota bacterium]
MTEYGSVAALTSGTHTTHTDSVTSVIHSQDHK